MLTADDIFALAAERERFYSTTINERSRIRRVLDGDARVLIEVISEIGTDMNIAPNHSEMVTANLILASGEQLARRIAATPTIREEPTNPDRKRAVTLAEVSEKVKRFWWQRNQMGLVGRQVSKWLLAYDECPIVVRPEGGIPCFEERDPLTAYPAPTNTWRPEPPDILFIYKQSVAELKARYEKAGRLTSPGSTMVKVYEHLDDEAWQLICADERGVPFSLRESVPNRIGEPMFVVPRLISFGRRQGAFAQLVGLLAAQARLTLLMLMAAERQVFPSTYISGDVKGNINVGPDSFTQLDQNAKVQQMSYNSSFQFLQEIDRFERAIRIGGTFPSQFSGETPSTLATGRGNQLLISATVDEGVKERQEILAEAYRRMFEKAVLVDKAGYWSKTKQKSIISTEKGQTNLIKYSPSELPEGTTRVEYGLLSATDAAQATTMLGQLLGAEILSEDGTREKHPFVDDPALEKERVALQRIDKALIAGLQQQVALPESQGGLPLKLVTRIKQLIRDGDDLEVAINKAQAELAPPPAATPGVPAGTFAAGQIPGSATPEQLQQAPGAAPPLEEVLSQLGGGGAA